MKVFSNEEIIEQYFVSIERIDFYLPQHKLAIDLDEFGHLDRDKEIQRPKKLEKCPECPFIRTNPDEKDFDVFDKVGEIRSCIDKLNKKLIKRLNEKSTTKSLIDNLSNCF